MIQIKEIEIIGSNEQTRQELDRDFLHSGYHRKALVFKDPTLTWRRPPRRSKNPITLVPMFVDSTASGRLEYLDIEGRLCNLEMRSGQYYFIPPNVPYLVEITGRGVLELFTPRTASIIIFDEEILPADFLQAHATAAPDKGSAPQKGDE